eukprot:jgi/Mesen1/8532/ME000482S07990
MVFTNAAQSALSSAGTYALAGHIGTKSFSQKVHLPPKCSYGFKSRTPTLSTDSSRETKLGRGHEGLQSTFKLHPLSRAANKKPRHKVLPKTGAPTRKPSRGGALSAQCVQSARTSEGGGCPMHGGVMSMSQALASGSSSMSGASAHISEEAETPIPGPAPWNIPQNLLDLSKIAISGIEEATLFYWQKYGGICRFANGVSAWTFVNDPAIVHHICFTNTKNYSLRFLPAVYEHVTHGKGILGSQGEYNRVHRKLCQPPFMRPQQLQHFASAIGNKVQDLVDLWTEQGGTTGDMALHMQRLTLDVIGSVAFSYDFGQIARIRDDPAGTAKGADEGGDALLEAVNESQALMGRLFITPLPVLRLFKWAREPGMRRLDCSLSTMEHIMMKTIQERREVWHATGDAGSDLLGALLLVKGLSDLELWEDVHDIMGAGHETTATTLTATLFSISQHPHVEAQVVKELERVLKGAPPSYEDISEGKLPYLTMAVKEALRLYPPIPLFPRKVAADDILPGGYKIPAGDVVFMSTYAMGRNSTHWPDPLTFDPERFLPEQEAERPKCAWVPFGAGPRMCLGAAFAQMSVVQLAAALLQRFKFKALKPISQHLPYAYDITMNFPGGVIMEASLR